MRSERIGRRTPEGNELVRSRIYRVSMLGLVLLVAGCASGNANDARQFEKQEAERVQKVPAAQSTQLAEEFLQPTGTPLATMTPSAGLSDLVLAGSVGSGGEPVDELRTVSAFSNQTVYAVAKLSELQPGAAVTALWRDEQKNVLFSNEVTPSPSVAAQWVAIPLNPSGSIGPGIYSIAIQVNGEFLESLAFQVA